jgi:hypothetical protein
VLLIQDDCWWNICGSDSRDQTHELKVIPLLSCSGNISKHLAFFGFSGPENEVDLILSRADLISECQNGRLLEKYIS